MTSILVRAGARIIVPLQLTLSVLVLLRGHNEPGGGFIGGLLCASAFILYGFAFGLPRMRKFLRITPGGLIGWGLLIAAVSALPALALGQPFFTGVWTDLAVQTFIVGKIKASTPLLFDIGVFLVVTGTALLMILGMSEPEEAGD
jgi:multicomponent Na+:H+ antiporter subunit B